MMFKFLSSFYYVFVYYKSPDGELVMEREDVGSSVARQTGRRRWTTRPVFGISFRSHAEENAFTL